MADYTQLVPSKKDFERAFHHADRLLRLQVHKEVTEVKMTAGVANDTVAAILQARDLVQHIFQSGYSLEDMHRWVDMLVAADEEERGRLGQAAEVFEPTKVMTQPVRPATAEDFAPGGMLDFLTGQPELAQPQSI